MPTFFKHGVEIVSAGIIFYRYTATGSLRFLMQRKYDAKRDVYYLEDMGGKSSTGDCCPEDTAAREAAEETNAVIRDPYTPANAPYPALLDASRRYILALLSGPGVVVLTYPRTKYALYLVPLPHRVSGDAFGTREIHPKWRILRTVDWYAKKDIKTGDVRTVHPRIRHLLRYL